MYILTDKEVASATRNSQQQRESKCKATRKRKDSKMRASGTHNASNRQTSRNNLGINNKSWGNDPNIFYYAS